jgi:hypothetical protein
VPSVTDNPTGQPGAKKRAGRTKLGRPTRSVIAGRLTWLRCLVRAGRMAEAAAFHRKHGLHRYGATVPTVPTADTANGITATDTRTGSVDTDSHAAGPASPDHAFSDHGGAGVSQRLGRENWDKTTPPVQNSQCSPLATATDVPLAVEADLTRLAAKADYTPTVTPPAGESEGERGFGQAESRSGADNAEVTDKIVSVWPKVGEAIVGKLCRNKQYNELRVVGEDGREMWTKVGNWLFTSGLIRGERVLVRKIWGSGDDTDAEYEVVRRLDVNEPAEERRAESGSDSGSESVASVVAHESAVSEQQTPETSLDAQQTPVAILPQFQREEPDYPRKQESADDYIARIRAEAAMWANGQGR